MTPRATDWSLAFLTALLFTTGILSLVSGRTSDAWVFVLHGVGGAALGLVAGWTVGLEWLQRRLSRLRHADGGVQRVVASGRSDTGG